MKSNDQEQLVKPTGLNFQKLRSESSQNAVSKNYLTTDFAKIPEESLNPINSDELRKQIETYRSRVDESVVLSKRKRVPNLRIVRLKD